MKRLLTITSALAFALTASTTFAVEEASWGQIKQQTDDPGQPAAKASWKTDAATTDTSGDLTDPERTDAATFRPNRGGTLYIQDRNGAGFTDNIDVWFEVPKGAVAEPVEITMSVIGDYMSDLVVIFQPAGLVFLKDATLEVRIGTDLIDIDLAQLQVYHEYADGTVEESGVLSMSNFGDTSIRFLAAVSGFSRYGLRGSSTW